MEDERLIERFSELRAGMLVRTKGCGWCGNDHRGLLMAPIDCLLLMPGGGLGVGMNFPIVPAPHDPALSVDAGAVERRMVFEIITGSEQEVEAVQRKKVGS